MKKIARRCAPIFAQLLHSFFLLAVGVPTSLYVGVRIFGLPQSYILYFFQVIFTLICIFFIMYKVCDKIIYWFLGWGLFLTILLLGNHFTTTRFPVSGSGLGFARGLQELGLLFILVLLQII